MVLVYDRWKVSKNKYEGLISQITLWSSIDRSQETDSNSGVPGVALARSCGGSRSCIHSRNGGWHSVLPGRVFDCNPRVCLSIRPSVWARDARDAANDRSAWWQRTVFGTRATLAGCSGSSSSNRGVSDPWHPWRQKRVLYGLAPFSSSSLFQRERCAKAAHHSSPVYPHLRDCEIAVCLLPFSFLFFWDWNSLSFSAKCNFMNFVETLSISILRFHSALKRMEKISLIFVLFVENLWEIFYVASRNIITLYCLNHTQS